MAILIQNGKQEHATLGNQHESKHQTIQLYLLYGLWFTTFDDEVKVFMRYSLHH